MIAFTVPGCPRPKERARRGKGGGWYTPRRTSAYEDAVGWAARGAGCRKPRDGRFRVKLDLWFPDHRRVDADNCCKSVLDALNGIVWRDDSQVVELVVTRGIDRACPRAEVVVESLA